MILTGKILLLIVLIYAAIAGWQAYRLGITFRQALFYVPFKIAYRIDDSRIREVRATAAPVIYAITHQSRIEPALALSLLPADTLHILDEYSANAGWLEPWRELARTIPFNAEHLFVSRRFVRHLRGRGRLAVYLPENIQPDTKAFRLYRAVSRIADNANASVIPLHFDGTQFLPNSLVDTRRSRLLPKLTVLALPAKTIPELSALTGTPATSQALFARMAEVRAPASLTEAA